MLAKNIKKQRQFATYTMNKLFMMKIFFIKSESITTT